MRLVMTYEESDDCTYWRTITLPIIHDSPEAAYVDFIETLDNARTKYEEYKKYVSDLHNRSKPDFMTTIKAFAKTGITGGDFQWHGLGRFNIDLFANNEYPKFETLDEWYAGLD
jgi:hypothetical protein